MKVKYDSLTSQPFNQAISKIANHEGFKTTKLAYHVGRIVAVIETAAKKAQAEYLELLKPYAILDEKGKIPMSAKIKPELEDDWKKVVEEFSAQTFKIDKHKLSLEELEGVGLTPNELVALEEILLQEGEVNEKENKSQNQKVVGQKENVTQIKEVTQ